MSTSPTPCRRLLSRSTFSAARPTTPSFSFVDSCLLTRDVAATLAVPVARFSRFSHPHRHSPLAMDKRLFLRNALRQNKPAVGMWLTMPGTALARTIATVPGLNWILIDGEHGLVTDRDFYEVRWQWFRVVSLL